MLDPNQEQAITVELPERLLAEMRRMVEDGEAASPTEIIRYALEYYLRRLETEFNPDLAEWLFQSVTEDAEDPVLHIVKEFAYVDAEPAPRDEE